MPGSLGSHSQPHDLGQISSPELHALTSSVVLSGFNWRSQTHRSSCIYYISCKELAYAIVGQSGKSETQEQAGDSVHR